jgi:condensin complex subunit 1
VLPAAAKLQLVDALCSNLSVLATSAAAAAAAGGDANATALKAHRTALKVYFFFLHWVASTAEADAASASASAAAVAPTKAKGKSKKATADSGVFDWDAVRAKVVRPLEVWMDMDLTSLYRGLAVEEELLNLCVHLAQLFLESPAAMKHKGVRASVHHALGAAAMRYPAMGVSVVAHLVDLLHRYEHAPGLVAELAAATAVRHDDAKLALLLLREVGQEDPAHYKAQEKRDAPGVRNVAAFLCELSSVLPKLVATNVSMLMPHLHGESYPMRNAIVTVLGNLLATEYSEAPQDNGASAQLQAHLRTKQAMLDTLLERARDVNSYTRARVLQTWAFLAEARAIPLGTYLSVTQLAVGRLEDKASGVRKAACQLVATLLQWQPFGSILSRERFAATLAEYQAKLPADAPEEQLFDVEEHDEEHDEEDGEEAAGAAQQEEDVAGAATQEADTQQPVAEAVELAGGVESLRVLVASLTVAHDFAKLAADALKPIGNLLASR